MRKIYLLLIVFLIVVGASSAVLSNGANLTQRNSPARVTKPQVRKFKLIEKNCESGCTETYKAPDGQELSFVYACFSASAADARRDMQRMASEGRVANRRSWRNQRGHRVERIVAYYPADAASKRPTKILWYRRGDTCFSYIDAGSLKLAREFERSAAGTKSLSQYSR